MAELKVLDVFFALVAAAMGTCLRLSSPMSGSCLALVVVCFLVCRFSDESLAYAGDDGVVGIIFLRTLP